MKIGILILSTIDKAYDSLKCAQKRSWVKLAKRRGIQVVFAEGRNVGKLPIKTSFENDTLTIGGDDKLTGSLRKTIVGLDYMFESQNCDIVFRTNLSSFIDIDELVRFVELNKLGRDFYGGVHGRANILAEKTYLSGNTLISRLFRIISPAKNISFASGAGFFIGRNVFDALDKREPLPNVIDDVGVSLLGAEKYLDNTKFIRVWVDSSRCGVADCRDIYFDKNIPIFHYRFKSLHRDVDAVLLANFVDEKFQRYWLFGGEHE
jgi:hypothetical protein